MGKRDINDSMISETGNWNVAEKYVDSKIMKPLSKCDYYEDIASFGYESIIDELINHSAPSNDVIKYKALKRLIKELIKIINNSKFVLKKTGTKSEALKYKAQLKKLLPIVLKTIRVNTNQVEKTQSLVINKLSLFESILEKVSEIKSKLNEPLNKNHLIFTDKEEFDPKKFKERIKDRIINQG